MSKRTRTRVSNVLLPPLGIGLVVAATAGGHVLSAVATAVIVLLSVGSFVLSAIVVLRRRHRR
jgi:hypothetical protein